MTKTIFFILGLAAVACYANPAAYEKKTEYFGNSNARQILASGTTEQSDENGTTENEASLSPAGYVYNPPSGRLLTLPASFLRQRQQQQPSEVYGTPEPETSTPTAEYGPPEVTTTERDVEQDSEASDASEGNETTDEPESEILPSAQTQQVSAKQKLDEGVYFVQLADGSYQRVVYFTSGNLQNNAAVAAKIQLQPYVQSAPVYYNPLLVPQAVSYSSQYQSW